jgi:Fe2+ or Zn2+ uptake regulation protein
MTDLIADVTLRLKDQGGRMTAQRKLVLEVLAGLHDHPTAEQIFELAGKRDESLNLSTVYRTLRWLEQEGLISARRFDESGRGDRFDAALPVEHHHFICSVCKRVIEFDDLDAAGIKTRFEHNHAVEVHSISVVLSGICHECQMHNNTQGGSCGMS